MLEEKTQSWKWQKLICIYIPNSHWERKYYQ